MSNGIKLVIAKFVAKRGQADALNAAITRCIAPSRAEPGCIHYDLYTSQEDENTFLIHEKWQGDEAIAFHFIQPHFKQLLAETQPLVAGEPEIKSVDI
ncbi:putative quinol monooxygenase [Pantoea rwandensis]|uniref:Drug:proton antiporter n=1 Tax=Pantoea rwandensis TaxID=1076550 RepID=A0A1X1D3K0_9GAMM|nr:putative quinol monooxygenase [Pantoea rwandensis]ORM71160.1 drug:proton antiporter [Pantoea rwandensis]